jgi:dihydropteroate synthase
MERGTKRTDEDQAATMRFDVERDGVATAGRARVVAWPSAAEQAGGGVYAVRVSGLAAAAVAAVVEAGRRASLWATPRTDSGLVTLAGPLAGFAALFGDPELGARSHLIADALSRFRTPPRVLEMGDRVLNLERGPRIVGVLNATPDSFYDRGRYFARDAALARADEMVAEGADVIEVGGESARPGPTVSPEEEAARVGPLIGVLARRSPVPIAVDTYKPDVARRAVDEGAVLINDISGLADPRLAEVAAATGAALVVMHIQGRPKVRQSNPRYRSVVDEVYAFLEDRTAAARRAGVPETRLVVDPGFSFGKSALHDVELLRRLGEFRSLGYPIYLATSRKNYIRDVLGLPFEELLEGTAAAVAYGVLQGARLVRTHDVRFMVRLTRMLDIIVRPHARELETTPRDGSGGEQR